MSVNKVIILGRIGKDVEMRYLPSGDAVANFSVATSEKWKDKSSGEVKEATEWHRCNAFGPIAENIGKYFAKGSEIYLEGSIKTRQYEQDGTTKYSTEIRVASFSFTGGSKVDDGGGQQGNSRGNSSSSSQSRGQSQQARGGSGQATNRNSRPQQNVPQGGGFDEMDDDIPF